jgi:hypothetical protein
MTETMEPTRRTESDNILWNRKQYTCIKGPQCTVRSCPPRRLYSDSSKMLSTEFWCIRKVGGEGWRFFFPFFWLVTAEIVSYSLQLKSTFDVFSLWQCGFFCVAGWCILDATIGPRGWWLASE